MLAVNVLCTVLLLLLCSTINIKATCMLYSQATSATCSDVADVAIWGTKQWTIFGAGVNNQIKFATLKTNNFRTTPNLKRIKLFGTVNHIEQGAFNGLDQLIFLHLYKNEINEISVEMFRNLSVSYLILHESGVRHLAPGCFGTLPNLSILTIKSNFLPRITAGVFNNLKLSKLSLQSNEISIIEDGAFHNMNELLLLALNGNRLSTFEPKYLLGYNDNLIKLWLYQNFLTEINSAMFFGLPSLEIINVSYNHIVEIKDNSFNDVKNLTLLSLMNNRVEELHPGIFPSQGLSHVKKVYLQNNQMTFLSSGLLVRLPNLQTIALGGNPWQCPCLYHLISWLSNRNITRTCDDRYFLGYRPVCVVSLTSPMDCVYDVLNTRDLVRIYSKALSEYPDVPVCAA